MEMWDLCCSDAPRVAIAAPRGHAKSTAITFSYVLANIMLRTASHILIISSNEDIASDFVNDIRTELSENIKMADVFGFKRLIKDSESEVIGEFKDGSKFRVIAKGANQRMRGLKWERKRPNLVVVDDVEDEDIVSSEERRRKFKRWFMGALRPIISDKGKIRIVGTILHLDSLLENLMPKLQSKHTVVDGLRIYSSGLVRGQWLSIKYRAHNQDYSQILWSSRLNRERLIEIRDEYVAQGLLDLYNQEYLNDPIDDSVAYFKEGYFKASPNTEEWARRERRYYAAVDFAISKSDTANYTAIVVASIDQLGRIEIEHVRRGRWDSLEIVNNLFEVQTRYKPELFAAEKGHILLSLSPFLDAEQRRRQKYINMHPVAAAGDKLVRAKAMQGRMKVGDVYFPKEAEWYNAFYDELRKFDRGQNDDQVDAFAYIGLTLNEMVSPPSQEELDDDAYWEEFYKHGTENNGGRNKYTGY